MFKNIFKVVTREVTNSPDNVQILKITKNTEEANAVALNAIKSQSTFAKKEDGEGISFIAKTANKNTMRVEVWDEDSLLNLGDIPL